MKTYTGEQIRKMLKLHGADEKEIENFLGDLDKPENAPSDEFDPDDEGDYGTAD